MAHKTLPPISEIVEKNLKEIKALPSVTDAGVDLKAGRWWIKIICSEYGPRLTGPIYGVNVDYEVRRITKRPEKGSHDSNEYCQLKTKEIMRIEGVASASCVRNGDGIDIRLSSGARMGVSTRYIKLRSPNERARCGSANERTAEIWIQSMAGKTQPPSAKQIAENIRKIKALPAVLDSGVDL